MSFSSSSRNKRNFCARAWLFFNDTQDVVAAIKDDAAQGVIASKFHDNIFFSRIKHFNLLTFVFYF